MKTEIYFCNDLNEAVDFSKKKHLQKLNKWLMKYFFSKINLGSIFVCESFRQLLLQEVNKVYNNHKEEIVFNLKGKMTFREI